MNDPELNEALNTSTSSGAVKFTVEQEKELQGFIPPARMFLGKKLANYTKARQFLLKQNGNELLRVRHYAELLAVELNLSIEQLDGKQWLQAVSSIPDLEFHATACLFTLWADVDVLASLFGKQDKFRSAVFEFAEKLNAKKDIITLVLEILSEATEGNDYEVISSESANPN